MKADVNSSEFGEHIRLLLEGIAIQKKKRYPFTVIRDNNEQESIMPRKSKQVPRRY